MRRLMRVHIPFVSLVNRVGMGAGICLMIWAGCAPNPQSSAGETPSSSTVSDAPEKPDATTPPPHPAAPSAAPSASTPDWTTIERELRRAQTQCWTSARDLFPTDAARRQEAAQGFHNGMLQVIADKHQLTVDAMRAQLPEAAKMLAE